MWKYVSKIIQDYVPVRTLGSQGELMTGLFDNGTIRCGVLWHDWGDKMTKKKTKRRSDVQDLRMEHGRNMSWTNWEIEESTRILLVSWSFESQWKLKSRLKKLRKEAFEGLTNSENIEDMKYLQGFITALDTIISKKK